MFDVQQASPRVQDYAWSLAHDSCVLSPIVVTRLMCAIRFRTPLCVFFSPRIIAAACFILAQRAAEGPHSPSLDARISASPPSASLPTPPSHKPGSPDASRFAVDYFGFSELESLHLAGEHVIWLLESAAKSDPDALSIVLEFYAAQDPQTTMHVSSLTSVSCCKISPLTRLTRSRSPHQLTPHGRNSMNRSRTCCLPRPWQSTIVV